MRDAPDLGDGMDSATSAATPPAGVNAPSHSPSASAGAERAPGPSPPPVVTIRLPPSGDVVRVLVTVLGVLVVAVLLWQMSAVLLLAFAAILVAVALRALAALIARLTRFPVGASIATAVVLVALVSGGFAYFLGGELAAQARYVFTNLPTVLDSLGQQFGISGLSDAVMRQLEAWVARDGAIAEVLGATASLLAAAGNLLVAVTVGVYLAFRPEAYERGFLRLFPQRTRPRLLAAGEAAGLALHRWLRGQLVSILMVGVLTSVALLLIGIPSWLALGVLAGLLEFIPYVGPLIAAVPALLIALADGGGTVFWVVGAYIFVQQLQGSVIIPLVQQRISDLPPVIAILALTGMGIVFGPIGILLAIPTAIVASVMITRLYVHDVLHDEDDRTVQS